MSKKQIEDGLDEEYKAGLADGAVFEKTRIVLWLKEILAPKNMDHRGVIYWIADAIAGDEHWKGALNDPEPTVGK